MLTNALRSMFSACGLAACITFAVGCDGGGYTVRAKVIEGSVSGVTLVSADDPQLAGKGLSKVWVAVYREPDSVSPDMAGGVLSNDDGTAIIPLKGFGAGWMHEQWLVEGQLEGYENAATLITLPSNSKKTWMLITMTPGLGDPRGEDFRDQLNRYK